MFDWFKKAPSSAQLKVPQSELPAAAGLKREFAGHPSRGLTPARLATILQQAEYGDLSAQAELFMDMEEKDAHLAAELTKRKMAVTQLDWELCPVRDASAREKKATEKLENLLRDELDLSAIRMAMLDAIGHGYACLELEWARHAGGLWLPRVIPRSPTWFQCPAADRATLHLKDGTRDGAPLQPFGWLPHLHQARSGYIARTGLHRVLAWPYLYKNYSVRDLAEFLEIYGLPIRIGKYPTGTEAAARQALLDSLLSIGHHAAGIIPDSMQVEIVNAMAGGNADGFKAMIEWCEASQSKAILGGTLTSQTGANGNRSLGDVHNEVRLDIRNDDASQVDRSLTNYLVYPIAVLNGFLPDGRTPDFVSDTQEPDDLALYADALPKLVAIGARIPRAYINEKLKIPEPEEDEEILGVAAPVSALPAGETPALPGADPAVDPARQADPTAPAVGRVRTATMAAGTPAADPDPTPVTALTDTLETAATDALSALLETVRRAVERADSLEALRDDLLASYGEMDSATLTSVLQMAFATADLAGRVDVRREAGLTRPA